MSLSVTNANQRTIVFVKIELDGLTLRYATENVMAKDVDGVVYFWEGRVLSLTNLNLGFNDFRDANAFISNVGITLSNGKDSLASGSNLDSIVEDYFWGGRKVTIWIADTLDQVGFGIEDEDYAFIGSGDNGAETGPDGWQVGEYVLSDPSASVDGNAGLLFRGRIGFPDVFSKYDDVELSFNVYDLRYQAQRLIAPNTFDFGPVETSLRFPFIQVRSRGRTAPVIFGDYSKIPSIPATVVDEASENKILKLADSTLVAAGQSPIHSVQIVTVDGIGAAFENLSLSNATLTIDPSQFNLLADLSGEILVACKGKTRGTDVANFFGGSADDLLEHPIEIIFDLATYYMGFQIDEIDSESFVQIKTAFPTMKSRSYISSGESVIDSINSICFEFGIEMYFDSGSLFVERLSFQNPSITSSFDSDDQINYSTSIDPNKQYFNQVSVQFQSNNSTTDALQSESIGNAQKRVLHNSENRDFNFKTLWNYDQASVLERFGRLLYISSLPIRRVNLNLTSKAFLKRPAEWIEYTFHIFNESKLWIRSLSKDLSDLGTSIEAFDLGTFFVKMYAEDSAAIHGSIGSASSSLFAVFHVDYTISAGYNDSLAFTTTGGSFTATLTPGVYGSPELLASEIQRAINGISDVPISVTYDRTEAKFTISTNDSSNLELNWTDTEELGRSTLGFDVSADDTGTHTYTSNYPCPFDGINQVSMWD